MSGPAWLEVACPRCGAEAGRPCWRTYPVLPATLRAAEEPTLGYCTVRPQAAREARQRAQGGPGEP